MTVEKPGSLFLDGGAALQNFDGFFHHRIIGRSAGSGGRLGEIGLGHEIVNRRMDFDGGADAFAGNILAGGREVIGDGENQGGAVVHVDQLLLGGGAVGAFADGVAALVVAYGGGQNFGGAGGAIADEHANGLGPDYFGGVGGIDDGGDGLAFQSGDGAGGKKELRGVHAFLIVAERAIAQIENQFLGAAVLELHELFADLLGRARSEFDDVEIGDVSGDFIFDEFGRRELRESDGHFLRLGFAAADDGERHGGSGIALEQELGLVNGHLAGGEAGDFFEDVADAQADFGAGTIGEDADHADVAEAASEGESGFARGGGRQSFPCSPCIPGG